MNKGNLRLVDGLVDNVDYISSQIQEAFVRQSMNDAREVLESKPSFDELAYMFYCAYTLGINFGQIQLTDLLNAQATRWHPRDKTNI